MSDEYINYHIDKKKIKKLLEDTRFRKDIILSSIYKIKRHGWIGLSKVIYNNILLSVNKYHKFTIKKQLLFTDSRIEYLVLNNDMLIPVYPLNIQLFTDDNNSISKDDNVNKGHKRNESKEEDKYTDKGLMDINFGDLDILSPEYYQPITKYFDNKDLFSNFAKDDETNYTISKILYNPVSKKIIGIKFENNLVVPVIEERLIKKDLISNFNKYFKSKRVNQDNINDYIENILYDFNLGIDNNRLQILLIEILL